MTGKMVFYFGTIPPLVEKREVYAMQATLGCPRCSGRRIIKNGWLRGEQRYRCKDCSYNFVDPPKPDRPLVKKVLAILLYNPGLSFRATGKLCGVSGTTSASISSRACSRVVEVAGMIARA